MNNEIKELTLAAVAALALSPAPAGAQSAPTAVTPQAYMQLGTPSVSGAQIDIYRVPIVTSTGAIIYRDVLLHFDVSASGVLSLSAGYPVYNTSSTLLSGNFLAGKNTLNGVFYDLSGPGVGASGRSSWSLDLEAASSGCLVSAGWTTGPVTGHPLQSRLTAAKITYGGYAYGVLGALNCTESRGIPAGWTSGALIGAASTGNGLTIYRYTNNSGVDQASAVDSISLQKCPTTGSC